MSSLPLFGLVLEDTTLQSASTSIVQDAKLRLRRKIYFINAHCVNVAAKDKHYLDALSRETLLFADGSGMRLASRLTGRVFRDNVNGTDLFPLVCQDAADVGVKMAFLGAQPGIAERCARNMRMQFPNLQVVWVHDGFFQSSDEATLIRSINDSGADMLFVAMGVPKQELWIDRNAAQLNVPILLGVGALFDFYSGAVPRAPLIMRRMGIEWFFRFLVEPRRMFARYWIGNFVFMFRALFRRLQGQGTLQNAPLINNSDQLQQSSIERSK